MRGRCTYKTRCRFAHPPFEVGLSGCAGSCLALAAACLPCGALCCTHLCSAAVALQTCHLDRLASIQQPATFQGCPPSIPQPSFQLPDSLPRPKSPIAKPSADAVVYGGKAAAKAAKAGGVQGVATPESPAVVAAPRVVAVKGGKPVQLVKPGGKAAASGAAAAAAAAAPADTPPPPPLKPAPWANVKPGVPPPMPLPPVPLPPAEVPGVAAVAAAAAAAAAGGGDSSAGFSLFGGSSPLLLPNLGAAGEPALPGLAGEPGMSVVAAAPAAEATPPAAPALPAFGGSTGISLFGGSIFGQH